jgi:aminopeptidase N
VRALAGGPKGAPPAPLRFGRPGDTLVVLLAHPAALGDTVVFTVDYRGRVRNGRGLYFFPPEPGRARRYPQIYSGGGTDGNPNWIPTYGPPNDKCTWELVATVPAGFTVVSNGRLVSDRPGPGDTHAVHWHQTRPASTYLLSIVVAPLTRVRDRWRDVPVDYYVYPGDTALARPLFDVTPDMMEVFSRLTGVPYPWEKYAQAIAADFIGGMENVNATTLVDWLPDRRAYLDRPWYRHSLIPHELAHQWFGNLVTSENWANYWLNEGTADFMPGQYWGEKLGRHAEEDYYLEKYRQFLGIDARRRMPLAALGSNNIYPKGALVMWMLKKHLGPERFWASMRRYLTRHAFDNATSDDLRQAILDATGENLAWFFDQWVYAAGYPELEVTASHDPTRRTLTLAVRQLQADTARPDSTGLRYVTPAAFRMPVSVRVGTTGGDVVRRVWLGRRSETIRIAGLPGDPTMVVFDEGNRVLKTLAFAQPTRWLATQLARDPDLWNRQWVIGRLAERPGDSLAAAALARAARGADWFTTRAQAAAALAAFPAAVAVPPLEAAARDTSAQVREAAVAALGVLGGPRALTRVRAAWARDPSYEVRAAALTALARLDPRGARAALREGLATPSYRDVIQGAAVAAVVQAPDSALVAALDAALGGQELVAVGLAALAGRGDAQALAILRRRLDDERPWVRRWVLDGVVEALGPEEARGRLEAAAAGLRRPDAREDVAETLDRLAGRATPE